MTQLTPHFPCGFGMKFRGIPTKAQEVSTREQALVEALQSEDLNKVLAAWVAVLRIPEQLRFSKEGRITLAQAERFLRERLNDEVASAVMDHCSEVVADITSEISLHERVLTDERWLQLFELSDWITCLYAGLSKSYFLGLWQREYSDADHSKIESLFFDLLGEEEEFTWDEKFPKIPPNGKLGRRIYEVSRVVSHTEDDPDIEIADAWFFSETAAELLVSAFSK